MQERTEPLGASGPDERGLVPVLLLVIFATGMIDAVCLLHLGVFTAYMTGSLILFGAHLVGVPGSAWPNAVAVVSFVLGAAAGARGLRARTVGPLPVGPVLAGVAGLVLVASLTAARPGFDDGSGDLPTIAILALAMGVQIAVVRRVAVPDLGMAAATVIIFNLVADSPAGGGTPTRTGRRLGVVVALVGGAAAGAALARWEPAASWAAAAAVLAVAAAVAWTRPVDPSGPGPDGGPGPAAHR